MNAKADADSNGIRGGRNARGTLGLEDKGVGGGKFTADVVCLRVVGSRAWIGAIVSKSDLPGYRVGTHVVRYLIDRGPGASAPPDLSRLLDGVNARLCGRYTPRDLLREVQGNLTVHDN